MPLYEYECAHCGPFSDFRPMADYALPAICPNCSAEAPRALISVPAMVAGGVLRPATPAPPTSSASGLSAGGGHGAGCRCGCGSRFRIRREDWVRKLL